MDGKTERGQGLLFPLVFVLLRQGFDIAQASLKLLTQPRTLTFRLSGLYFPSKCWGYRHKSSGLVYGVLGMVPKALRHARRAFC